MFDRENQHRRRFDPRAALAALVLGLCLASSARASTPLSDGRLSVDATPAGVRLSVPADAPGDIVIAGDAIVPIDWHRDGATRATLPIVLRADATAVVLDVGGASLTVEADPRWPTLATDAARYRDGPPPADRRSAVGWFAVASIALALAARSKWPARSTLAVGAVAAIAFAVALASRGDLERRATSGGEWWVARRPTRATLDRGRPVFESKSHAAASELHVEATGADRATFAWWMASGSYVFIAR